MRPFTQSTKFADRSRQQAGQGTVEFVLVLVVSVALILAVSAKIYKPMGQYAKSYMGDYLACLLDRGTLPKMGSEEDPCADSLSLSADNPLAPQKNGKLVPPTRSSSKDEEKNKASKDQQEMTNSRSGQQGRAANGSPQERNFTTSNRGGDSGSQNSKTSEVANNLTESKYYKSSSAGTVGNEGSKTTRVEGQAEQYFTTAKEKLRRQEGKISKIELSESPEETANGKKIPFKPPQRKIAQEQDEEPWSFGKLIRYSIIAIILIAILVFLSGQALQISKSWEK